MVESTLMFFCPFWPDKRNYGRYLLRGQSYCGKDVGGCRDSIRAPSGQGGDYGAESCFPTIILSNGTG